MTLTMKMQLFQYRRITVNVDF